MRSEPLRDWAVRRRPSRNRKKTEQTPREFDEVFSRVEGRFSPRMVQRVTKLRLTAQQGCALVRGDDERARRGRLCVTRFGMRLKNDFLHFSETTAHTFMPSHRLWVNLTLPTE